MREKSNWKYRKKRGAWFWQALCCAVMLLSSYFFGASQMVWAQQAMGSAAVLTSGSTHYELRLPYHLQHAEGSIDARYFSCIIKIECGQKDVSIGDLVQYAKCSSDRAVLYARAASLETGFSYQSDNPDSLAIDANTGVMQTKREGTALVHITKGDLRADITVIIAAKGNLGTNSNKYSKVRSKLKTLKKDYKTGVTKQNCYTVYNDLQKLRSAVKAKQNLSLMYKGFGMDKDGRPTNELILPQLARAEAIRYELHNYAQTVEPTSTSSKNKLEIKSVSGKGGKVTVTLKKKLTKEQVFGLICYEPYDEEDLEHLEENEKVHPSTLKSTKQISWRLFIQDTKTNDNYWGEATSKVGKKQIQIKLLGSTLKKKRKYMLRDTRYKISAKEEKKHWTEGKTFKAK